jgi:hypothetical protein
MDRGALRVRLRSDNPVASPAIRLPMGVALAHGDDRAPEGVTACICVTVVRARKHVRMPR